jgi:cell division protein FtsZ
VTSATDQNANVIFGAVIDESLVDEVRVTVIATGFGPARLRRRKRTEEPAETGTEPEGRREVPAERFEVSEEILEVPSFLRE